MAYVDSNAGLATPSRISFGIFGKIATFLMRQRLYAQTLHELSLLSDRELADLGLERDAIASVARKAAYDK